VAGSEAADVSYVLPTAKRGRPRGFKAWQPRAATRELLEQVHEVLHVYRSHLPCTARQVFYRLVAAFGFDKSEAAYERLGNVLNRARRAGLVPWSAIRDDGFHRGRHTGWESLGEFAETVQAWVDRYQVDRQAGQERRLAVWCEAGGMVPQLERVAGEYSVPVCSSGGFDSVTAKHDKAEQFAAMGSVLVLHVGDHDPSGVHVFGSLDEDVRAFCRELGGEVEFRRLAVLPKHVEQFGLVTSPAKVSDRRAFHGATVQAEALPPDVLAGLVRSAIESELDLAVYAEVLEREREQRATLAAWAGSLERLEGER
jgi:hypothetical protein